MSKREAITRNPAYRAWVGAIQRCEQPNQISYRFYGGRGIKVSQDWKDFDAFRKDMEATFKPGMRLLRRDRNGDFCKSNCFWGTKAQQHPGCGPRPRDGKKNGNRLKLIVYQGEEYNVVEFCQRWNIEHSRLKYRLRQKWTPAQVVETPKGARVPNLVENDTSWATFYGDGTPPPPTYVKAQIKDVKSPYTEYHTIDGETKTLKQWAIDRGFPPAAVRYRLNHLGWSLETALSVPIYRARSHR